jgi:hypothetical protein
MLLPDWMNYSIPLASMKARVSSNRWLRLATADRGLSA